MLTGEIKRVAILGGNRIPFARSGTNYLNVSNQQMLSAALNGLVSRYNLEGKLLGEVVAGAVMKHSRDFNLTRECVLGSKLAPETSAYDIQQACGTGLEAAILVANKIALGQIDAGIAGGVDTTSDAPIAVSDGLRKVLMNVNAAKTGGDRAKAFLGLRPSHLAPALPKNSEPR
ncbi:MAG: acetyl-CoA C-acyltransferase, partial [Gammaproteobacteria bacterium]|nr:acetyl-CoA C-acyltransferase [Gammaproteobacteria bacterium]